MRDTGAVSDAQPYPDAPSNRYAYTAPDADPRPHGHADASTYARSDATPHAYAVRAELEHVQGLRRC